MEKSKEKVCRLPATYLGFLDRMKVKGIELSQFLSNPIFPFARYFPNTDTIVVQIVDVPIVFVERFPHTAGILYELSKMGSCRGVIGFQINNIHCSKHRERILRREKWKPCEIVPMLVPDITAAFGEEAGEIVSLVEEYGDLVVRFI